MKAKKGVAIWMSWVLIVSSMVALGAIMYNWMYDYTSSSAERLETSYNKESCSDISLEIDACQKAETLNIIINNNGNLNVNQIIFRFYDIYGNIESKDIDILARAGKDTEIETLKQGTLRRLEAIPVLIKDNDRIICREKIYQTEVIPFC